MIRSATLAEAKPRSGFRCFRVPTVLSLWPWSTFFLNDLKVYDAEFLKKKTNGPYLIGPDQLYIRDKATDNPFIWDPVDNKAKVFNDPTIKDFALEGTYTVNGVKCSPAFQLIKEHVKQYTPEAAEKESTVPAAHHPPYCLRICRSRSSRHHH